MEKFLNNVTDFLKRDKHDFKVSLHYQNGQIEGFMLSIDEAEMECAEGVAYIDVHEQTDAIVQIESLAQRNKIKVRVF